MLGNSNFNTYFSKNFIYDCNVIVSANEGGMLFDKEHIASMTMTRENECALSFAPNDTVVIDVIKWNTLSQEIRDYLTTPTSYAWQNFVWLFFEVNGDSTTYGIVFAVEKVEVNTKKWHAKLTLCSPFKTKTGLTWGWLLSPYGFDTFPNGTTSFEALQHTAVNLGKGMVIPNYQDYYWNDYDFIDLDRSIVDLTLNTLNITSDIVESEDENDRSDIEFVGIKAQTPDTLYTQTKAPTTDYWGNLVLNFDTFNFEGKSYVISAVRVNITHAGTDVTSQFNVGIYSNQVSVTSKSGASLSSVNYVLTIEGYEAELDEPQNENYAKSYVWVTGSQGLTDAQAKTRAYYSNKKYIDFDCRLDPRIEPLDNIFVSGVGTIKVEKVTMKFNGGFSGHIRGRLIDDADIIKPRMTPNPLVMDEDYGYSGGNTFFSFTIHNDNAFAVTLNLSYSQGIETRTIQANSSITLTQNNASRLSESFYAKWVSDLQESIVAYFTAPNHDTSASIVVLEDSR